jgi:nicotinate-nucleotide adenylyltransferase
MAVGLFGGAFDPPHNGHVAVARCAKEHLELERLIVLVSEAPGHKDVELPAEVRLELARAAFPDDDVRLDPYPRTIDLLRAERFDDPVFIVGADQFVDFLTWKEPEAVLELARLGVATRPGFDRGLLDTVLRSLEHPDRVLFFDMEPNPAASRDIRAGAAAPLESLVPPAVARLIRERGLYHD